MIQYIGDIEFEAKVLLARIFSNLTKDEQDSLSFSIEVGDVSEGKYDWKIVKEQGIGGFSI